MKKSLLAIACFIISFLANSQNVAINNDASQPDAKAILDIKSTIKGILIPRMLKTEREAITLPPQGLIVYQTDQPEGLYYQAAVTGLINWKRAIPTDGQHWSSSLSGDHISNTNSGNVGIGNGTPSYAGLVVDRKVDKVHAMFGTFTPGVSIESINPGIGLNSYYSTFRRAMGNGYGGLLGIDVATGDLYLQSSSSAGTIQGALTLNNRLLIDKDGKIGVEGNSNPHAQLSFASTLGSKISLYGSAENSNYGFGIQGALLQLYTNLVSSDIAFGYGGSAPADFTENMRIKGNGNVGIGVVLPVATLDVKRGTATEGTAKFSGTNYPSHFNYSTTEDTYLRGGKTTSKVIINDLSTGDVSIAAAGGNVTVGNVASPTHTMTVAAVNDGIITKNGAVEIGTYVSSSAAYLQTYSSHPLFFSTNNGATQVALLVNGNFGIGISIPTAKLEVAGQIKITGGIPGLDKVLTSDANGLASWQTPDTYVGGSGTNNFVPKFSSGSTLANSLIVDNGSGVGVGTFAPTLAKLQVQGGVGNTIGLFNLNANSQGIALVSDNPGVFFNSYYNGGIRAMSATGFPSVISTTQTTGDMIFMTTEVANTTAGAIVTPTERMRIKGNGSVGIGADGAGYKLEVIDGNVNIAAALIQSNSAASSSDALRVQGGPGGESRGIYSTANSVGVSSQISGAGSLKWGIVSYSSGGTQNEAIRGVATAPGATHAYGIYATSSFATVNYAGYFAGNVFTTAAYLPSDRSLKTNIRPLNGALSLINKLNPTVYNYKVDEYRQMQLPEGMRYGLIADEVLETFPGLVKKAIQPAEYEMIDGRPTRKIKEAVEFNAVNYSEIIPILVGSIKELNSTIEVLKERIEFLEKK